MSREADRSSRKSSANHEYLVKLLGLSNSTTKDDIRKFLSSCHIVTIHLFNNNNNNNNSGHSSDQCLVDLESESDVRNALKKNQSTLANRSIEVIRATIYEYNFYMKHKGTVSWQDPVIRMDGLPYTCTMADVQNFFKDVSIARNGIYISRDMTDDACGGGYVAFVSMDNAYKAIDIYNQQNIQHRYIELAPSNYDEAKAKITNDALLNGKRFAGESVEEERKHEKNGPSHRTRTRSNSRDRSEHHSRPVKRRRSPTPPSPSRSRPQPKRSRRSRSRSPVRRSTSRNGEYLVKMRGMPFNVTENDIRKFFPSTCKPVRIEILQNHRTKRPNGDGHVYFSTREEANQAMKCDRKYMGNRYIELYFDSPRHSPSPNNNNKRRLETPPPLPPSRSPSKSKDDIENTPSRSESEHEFLE